MTANTGKPAVRITRSKGIPEVRCEEDCPAYIVLKAATGEYAVRIAARFHVRETGHPVTVSVTEETRYETGEDEEP